MKLHALVLLCAATCVSTFVTAQTSADKTIFVTAVASSDAPVLDLSWHDFVLTEDKAPLEITGAELSTETLSIVLLLDTTKPPMGDVASTQDIRTAVSTFMKTVQTASPTAEIALVTIAGAPIKVVDFTTKTADLDKVIQRLVPDQRTDSVALEALVDASSMLGNQPGPRRAIVLVGFNSQDTSATRMGPQAQKAVQECGATLWPVTIAGTSGTGSPVREEMLNVITPPSGGMRVAGVAASGLESLLKKVANSLLSQYNVTFARKGTPNKKALRIETTRGGKVLLSPWMR